jgi:hypothetical protein
MHISIVETNTTRKADGDRCLSTEYPAFRDGGETLAPITKRWALQNGEDWEVGSNGECNRSSVGGLHREVT